jgi:hypothetical protein
MMTGSQDNAIIDHQVLFSSEPSPVHRIPVWILPASDIGLRAGCSRRFGETTLTLLATGLPTMLLIVCGTQNTMKSVLG